MQEFGVVFCLIQPHEERGDQCKEVLVVRIVRSQLFKFDEAGVDPRRVGAIGVRWLGQILGQSLDLRGDMCFEHNVLIARKLAVFLQKSGVVERVQVELGQYAA